MCKMRNVKSWKKSFTKSIQSNTTYPLSPLSNFNQIPKLQRAWSNFTDVIVFRDSNFVTHSLAQWAYFCNSFGSSLSVVSGFLEGGVG